MGGRVPHWVTFVTGVSTVNTASSTDRGIAKRKLTVYFVNEQFLLKVSDINRGKIVIKTIKERTMVGVEFP